MRKGILENHKFSNNKKELVGQLHRNLVIYSKSHEINRTLPKMVEKPTNP